MCRNFCDGEFSLFLLRGIVGTFFFLLLWWVFLLLRGIVGTFFFLFLWWVFLRGIYNTNRCPGFHAQGSCVFFFVVVVVIGCCRFQVSATILVLHASIARPIVVLSRWRGTCCSMIARSTSVLNNKSSTTSGCVTGEQYYIRAGAFAPAALGIASHGL